MRFERVVVTGGSGRLGRYVVDELQQRCDVAVLDITPPRGDAPYAEADILDDDAVRAALAGNDAVIHLAGLDDGKARDDSDYFHTNVPGAWNVIEAAETVGIRKIVVASSTAVLGLGRSQMPDYLPVDENHPPRTTSPYGMSKQSIESISRYFARRGDLEIVCLRPTWIIQPEEETVLRQKLAPGRSPTNLDETNDNAADAPDVPVTGSYVRPADAARCFRMALDYDAAPFGVFNVSARDSIGGGNTLERLRELYGRLPEIRDPRLYRDNPAASILDIRRTRDLLSWEPDNGWSAI